MAVREERWHDGPHAFAGRPDVVGRAAPLGLTAAVVLAILVGGLYGLHLDRPAFFDNEGRFAEVAREMVASGDYVTPTMDGTLFLNKPPLVFWLSALVYRVAGPTEWARLVSVAAAMIALVATCRLGALLYGELVGLVAGLMLATSLGVVLEARTLRPDMVITASVVVALLCWQRSRRADSPTPWLIGLYVALGVGIMAKGLVPIAVAGLPIGIVTVREQGWKGVRTLNPLLGMALVGAIVLPWHALIAWRHPGFAWDYVVNQHLLVFLGRKPTLDAVGDPLLPFWGAAFFRAIPWILVLPCSFGDLRVLRRESAPGRATALLWTWVVATMIFFSLTPSRLEHYAIPTLPGIALLAARGWQRLREGEVGRGGWLALGLAGATVVAVGSSLAVAGPAFLAQRYWLVQAPVIGDLVAPAGWVLVAGGGLVALAALRTRATALVAGLAAAMLPLGAIIVRAEVAVEPLFSWAPVAAVLDRQVPPEVEVVFESPQEYQLVGGLAFYARRRITLLEPVGYTAPAYLARLDRSIFLSRPEFERRWRAGEPLVLVSDPLQRRDSPDGIVPGTYTALARFGDRWVLRNGLAPSSG